jgi:hypothetical protein
LGNIGRGSEVVPAASISQDPASKTHRIHVRYGGKQFQKSAKTTDETEAVAAQGRIE